MRLSISALHTSVIVILFLLSGCTITPSEQMTPINVSQASQAKAWELQGKIAVKTAEEKFSTNLYWLHQPTANDLRLTTVLGTTVLVLTTTEGMATLEVDGKTYHDRNAQELLTGISGWSIPLDNLPLWITGQTSSKDEVVSYNSDGTIKQLISNDPQADWHVTFMSWQQQSGAPVPKLLKIERDDVQIKIQTNQWTAVKINTK